MSFIHQIYLIDPAIGRIDKASLTTQTQMEIFIDSIENKDVITKDADTLAQYQKWTGVSHDWRGFHILWRIKHLEGSINFRWLPDSVTWLNVSSNKLNGTVDLSTLDGSALEILELAWNDFSGSLDLCYLPPRLRRLDFADNAFEGTMDLTHLPPTLIELIGPIKKFSGTLCLDVLPPSLKTLRLSKNNFEGQISLKTLPKTLHKIDLGDCKLSGSLDLTQLPEQLEGIYLQNNNFSGDIQIRIVQIAAPYIQLEGNLLLSGEMHLTGKQHSRITAARTNIQRIYTDRLKA